MSLKEEEIARQLCKHVPMFSTSLFEPVDRAKANMKAKIK